jgi:acetolactate decarboxylase
MKSKKQAKPGRLFRVLFCAAVALLVFGAAPASRHRDVLYQYSTISALKLGIFDGKVSYAKLASLGDFGIGTFNGLDGEMIALDHRFYQITSDGKVRNVSPKMKAPFAMVKYFEPSISVDLKDPVSLEQLEAQLEQKFPGPNLIYAVKITGRFQSVKVRSVPAQRPPYPTLAEAVKRQTVFELKDVEGTMVGFWFPQYLNGVNQPGYHFHFISADHLSGGHLLDCQLESGVARLDQAEQFNLIFPDGESFLKADLSPKAPEEHP